MSEKDHVEALITAKVTKPNCIACDANAWKVSEEVHFLIAIRDATVHSRDGMPVHALVCTNCGFVRLHAAAVL
jgi:hypothetical protein